MSLERKTEQADRLALRRRAAHEAATADADHGSAPHPIVALQRHVGNAHIERMLAQRAGDDEEQVQAKHDDVQREEEEEEAVQAKHDDVQREGAEEEEEAAQASHDPMLSQREGEEEEETAQASHDTQRSSDAAPRPEVGLEGGPVSDDLSSRINSRRGAGASLDDGTRSSMERSFGTDLKDVRIHTDAESDSLNRSISAKAFTTGNDIFFRKDASPGDHGLLAHELTHVVQQRSMSGSGGGMKVGPAGDAHEQHADGMAAAVTSGTASTAAAQREADEAQAQRTLAQREAEEEEETAG